MSPYRVATKTIFTHSACEVIVMADSQAEAEAKLDQIIRDQELDD
jgi:hypothetical protein